MCGGASIGGSIQLDLEIQMNKFHVFSLSLAAILAGPAHAQMCSGGTDGGMDATGNQCNTPVGIATVATAAAITPPTQITKMANVRTSASRPALRTHTVRRSEIYASAQVSSAR